jgi:hypothetical protein
MTDRVMLQDHLEMTERHVALGERHVSQQRARLEALRRNGEPIDAARTLLQRFEELHALHVEHRDRLVRTLSEPEP